MTTDLNTASQRELQRLPGIGPVIAQRIIDARPFGTLIELQRVNGIGAKRYLGLVSDRLVTICSNAYEDTKSSLKMGESVKAAVKPSAAPSMKQPLVDINHASIKELLTLRGVGPVRAQDIVDARPFYRKDQITAVRGIGLLTYEKMKDQLKHPTAISPRSPKEEQEEEEDKESEQMPASPVRRMPTPPSETVPIGCYTSRVALGGIRQSVFPDHSEVTSTLLLASWNIRNISKKKDAALLHRICDILSEFDLVALQEVRDTIVLKRLKNMMPGWDYIASPLVGRDENANGLQSKNRTEHFAFFYRRSACTPVGKAFVSSWSSATVRAPWVAHFDTCSGTEDMPLTLVNVHVACGDNESKQEEIRELLDLAARLRMAQEPAERRSLVLLGDFNLAPHDIDRMSQGGCQFEPLIRSPLASMVSGKLYDNIWMDAAGDWPSDLVIESGVYRFDWVFFPHSRGVSRQNKMPALRRQAQAARDQCSSEVSDHCPVWLAFGSKAS